MDEFLSKLNAMPHGRAMCDIYKRGYAKGCEVNQEIESSTLETKLLEFFSEKFAFMNEDDRGTLVREFIRQMYE